jgi:hypothetical protein
LAVKSVSVNSQLVGELGCSELVVLLDAGEEGGFAGGGRKLASTELAELGEGVLVEQAGAEHGRVVGVERDHEAEVEVGA